MDFLILLILSAHIERFNDFLYAGFSLVFQSLFLIWVDTMVVIKIYIESLFTLLKGTACFKGQLLAPAGCGFWPRNLDAICIKKSFLMHLFVPCFGKYFLGYGHMRFGWDSDLVPILFTITGLHFLTKSSLWPGSLTDWIVYI